MLSSGLEGAHMRLAHWTTAIANPGLEDAEEIVEHIPAGTSSEDVIARLLLVGGANVEITSKFSFESDWPREIRKQFLDENSGIRRLSWNDLQ